MSQPSKPLVASLAFAILAACATTERPLPATRPPSSAELAMGYQEAVDLGTKVLSQRGYQGELQAAEQVQPNIWCVRFGLAPRGSRRVLELYFDGTKRTLIKSTETDGVAATLTNQP